MDRIINLSLMKRPANWIKLFLMVFIALFALHIVRQSKSGNAASN